MVKRLSEREYAKHRGCARSSVQEARRTGRLSRSVTTDAKGRIWIDPVLADAEWKGATLAHMAPLTGPTAPRSLSPAELAKVARRLAAVVAADCDEVKAVVLGFVPHVVEGAAEALRSSGRAVSRAALEEALRLDEDDEDAAIGVSLALQELAADMDGGPAKARQVGREAAIGAAKGGRNGDA